MIRKIALFIAALVISSAPQSALSAGAGTTVIFSGPGSYATTYTTPAGAAVKGTQLTYVNADIQPHDVVSFAAGSDGKPWCVDYPRGGCPLFWTELITAGRSTPVLGWESAKAGAYRFYCSIHTGMTGVLVVAP